MVKAGITHHVTIADQAGTNLLGFMLAKRRGNQLSYEVADAEQVQPRVLTMGELTEAEAPPQLRLYWTEDDWRAGAGGIIFRSHAGRYHSSAFIEGSTRGLLRPARNFITTNNDAGIDDPNEHMPSGFAISGGDELWLFSGRDAYSWDYSDEDWGTLATVEETAGELYRNGVEFDGNTYIPCWEETEDFPREYAYKSEVETSWTKSTLKERAKYFTVARSAIGTVSLWAGFIQRGTGVLLNDGTNINSTDTALVVDGVDATTVLSVGDFIVMQETSVDGAKDAEVMLVTAVGSATSVTVTRGALGTTATAHTDNSEIYRHLPHHIQSATNAKNGGAWNTSIAIGSVESPITALLSMGDQLIVCKTDGLWVTVGGGDARPLTPEFQSDKHPDNLRGAFNWNGHALLPLGRGGMYEYFDGRMYDISMRHYAPDVTDWHGRVAAIAGNPESIYVLILDEANTKYHALRGVWAAHEGRLDWRWHHIGEISYTTGTVANHTNIFAESQTSGSTDHRRVWFGAESTGSNLWPFYYPLPGDDQDATFTNSSSSIVRFLDFDANFPRIAKNCVAVDVDSNNLGAGGRQWALEYSLDGGAFKTDLTDAAGNADGIVDSTSGQETLTFPDGTTCDVFSLRAKPTSTAATSTAPEIAKVRVTFQLRPERLRLLPLTFYIAHDQTLLNGAMKGNTTKDLAQLRTWDNGAAPVTVVDIEGASRDYVFLPGNMRIIPRRREAFRQREWLVTVLLAQV